MLLEIGKLPSGRALTVRQFIEELYEPALDSRVRRETATGYKSKLQTWVIPKLGQTRLGELEPYVLDRWRDELVEKLSGRSALNVYRVFSTALNRAVKWRLIQSNPLLAVDAPRAKVRDLDVLDASEALDYVKAFAGHKLEPIVVLALATGLRPCELTALTWADVDLKATELRVRRGLHEKKSESWFEETKSDRSNRTVSLPAWAVEILKPLRGIGPLVPGDGADGHARPTEVAREYKRQVLAAKARYVPLRDLRHSHATLLLEAGVDVVVVSRRLGHSTVAITDQYYLRPKRSSDQKAADALGDLLALAGVKSGQALDGVTLVASDE